MHHSWDFQEQERTEDLGLNVLEFKYRIHDPAIGRFWQIDPLASDYVHNGTYNFAENRVIDGIELEGLEWLDAREADKLNTKVTYTQTERVTETTYRTNDTRVRPLTEAESKNTPTETVSKIEARGYNLDGGAHLPNEIVTDSGIVTVNFGSGFASDNFQTPDNSISQVAVEGYVDGIQKANNEELADISSVTITATTNGNHGNVNTADWGTNASNHYIPGGASAIDTGLINGQRPCSTGCETQRVQSAMENVSTIRENYGPYIKNKNNTSRNVGGHNTWIHTSFRKK